jgi:hypothetical protein
MLAEDFMNLFDLVSLDYRENSLSNHGHAASDIGAIGLS